MEIETVIAGFAALSPVVAGIVEAIKKAGLSSRYAPAASVAIGVFLAFLVAPSMATVSGYGVVLLAGLVLGLTASGLYSGVKSVKA